MKTIKSNLIADHHPDAVRLRLNAPQKPSLVPQIILGSIDGCITTFAIVAGSIGAGVASTTAVILGFANLLADGFSMGISTYEAAQSEKQHVDALRKIEQQHIEELPDGEREELRQIYTAKGLDTETVEQIVETISAQKNLWIDTMLVEEYGVKPTPVNSYLASMATFTAFVVVGAIPLLPLLFAFEKPAQSTLFSAMLAGLIFFSIGFFKGNIYYQQPLLSGLKTLGTGSVAALLAYGTGHWLTALMT